jgi:hypothetical protein
VGRAARREMIVQRRPGHAPSYASAEPP